MHKSIRQLAQEHASRYEFSTDHDVNSYKDCYGRFHSPEAQYMDPNNCPHMYHPPHGENEHFYNAQFTHSSLLDQLEAQITVLEMHVYDKSVTSMSSRQVELSICIVCGCTSHLTEHFPEMHAFRKSREGHNNPMYELSTNYYVGNHWDHNQPFEDCDQYSIDPNDHSHMYHSPQWEVVYFLIPLPLVCNLWRKFTNSLNKTMLNLN